MGERKHKAEGGEKKSLQPQREEERQSEKQPTESLRLLAANVAHPADVQTLQRTIGNKAVTNIIQRHPEDIMNALAFYVKPDSGKPYFAKYTKIGKESAKAE